MGKRIFLFLATNLAIVLTLSIVLSLLGVSGSRYGGGYDIRSLAIFCLVWGMGGAFLSLQMSRLMPKRARGLQLVAARTGRPELDRVYLMVERLTQQANLPMPE